MKKISGLDLLNATVILFAVLAAGMERFLYVPIQKYFSYPSALIASFFLGRSPVYAQAHEVFIPLSRQMINVTSKCSAFGFFCLLCAILIINIIKSFPLKKVFMGLFFVFPMAYGTTLLVNGCRIVSGYYASRIGKMILPGNFQGVIHMGVGITIFLSVLILITLIFERIFIQRSRGHLIEGNEYE